MQIRNTGYDQLTILTSLLYRVRLYPGGILMALVFLQLIHPADASAQTTDSIWRPSFSSAGVGTDFGYTSGKSSGEQSYAKYAAGVSTAVSTSFLLTCFTPQTKHKFKIGDYFSGQLGTGAIHSRFLSGSTAWWTWYRFQVGLQSTWDIASRIRIGLKLILLDFSHNQLMQNTSGSSIALSFRQQRLELSGGLGSTRQRFLGWSQVPSNLNGQPHLWFAEAGLYLSRRQKVSVSQELFSNPEFSSPDPISSLTAHQLFLTHINYVFLF